MVRSDHEESQRQRTGARCRTRRRRHEAARDPQDAGAEISRKRHRYPRCEIRCESCFEARPEIRFETGFETGFKTSFKTRAQVRRPRFRHAP
ncbi:hypothetical protein [Paraburkholderia sp. J94]|uniref:hypothetical protein n=1 Tax=Paraburkholderia sp. J94 TaxID=2805441 RepID=UPI002AB059CE|nr:hypothetical protein [Paraburkholderia sp. J94]